MLQRDINRHGAEASVVAAEDARLGMSDKSAALAELAPAEPLTGLALHEQAKPLTTQRVNKIVDPATLGALLSEHHDDPQLSGALARQLFSFGDARAAEAVCSYLERHSRDEKHGVGVSWAMSALDALMLERQVSPDAAADSLLPILKSGSPDARRGALSILAREGHPAALSELAKIRDDSKAPIEDRLLAADYGAEDRQRTLERLLKTSELKPEVEARVLWALNGEEGRYKGKALEFLKDEDTNPALRKNLLLNSPPDGRIVPSGVIAAACASSNSDVSFGAMIAARLRGVADDPTVLRQAVDQPKIDPTVRSQLLDALAAVGAPEDRDRFTALLDDPSKREVRSALRYFGRVAPEAALDSARALVLEEGEPYEKCEALEVLAAAGHPEDAPLLLATAQRLSTFSDLPAILAALETRGDKGTIVRLDEGKRDEDRHLLILRSLARLGDDAAVAELVNRRAPRGERSDDFEALARSTSPLAQRIVHEELKNGYSSMRTAVSRLAEEPAAFNRMVSNLSASGDRVLIGWAEDLIQAKLRGIEHPFRFRPEDLSHIVETRRDPTPPSPGERQVLVVLPTSDHNGAFNGVAPAIASLRERGFRVVLFEAHDEHEVIEALQSHHSFGQSDAVFLGAHGAQGIMSFGGFDPRLAAENDEQLTIDRSDKKQLIEGGVSAALKEGGRVILFSCSTGEGGRGAKNMANFMREVFPGAAPRGIGAPPIPVRGFAPLRFDDSGLPIQPDHPWVNYYQADYRGIGGESNSQMPPYPQRVV